MNSLPKSEIRCYDPLDNSCIVKGTTFSEQRRIQQLFTGEDLRQHNLFVTCCSLVMRRRENGIGQKDGSLRLIVEMFMDAVA